jgi:orotidine-5'-phosphate decarboxylase
MFIHPGGQGLKGLSDDTVLNDGTGAKDRLIVALDVETAAEAREVFAALRDWAGMFKIGPHLFTSAGPEIVREIVAAGGRVFLDLKFHDIPAVVAAAGREAARLGVSLFTVHAAGGAEMLRRVAEAVADAAGREGRERPRVLGVTVLTSADDATLAETGVGRGVEEQVARLAALASASGLDGCIASPHEIDVVRRAAARPGFLVVTPGVRPRSAARDDQRRVMTPEQAVRSGADYIVVGRAILKAPDRARAAREIVEEMERGMGKEAVGSKQ